MLKRPCAIKLIRPEKAGNPANLKRFEREVRATATLSHWNSVDVFDYGRADDGTFYYVMEYLPGLNIQQLVEADSSIPASRIIHLMRQVCDALFESHGKGLIHRDIKPANIFAAQRGGVYDVAKLLDFGLVLSMSTSQDAALTQDGAIQGSPLYLSPEQAIGEKSDERSDIYSLGAVMYYMMTGAPPFDHVNPLKVIMAHAKDEPACSIGIQTSDRQTIGSNCLKVPCQGSGGSLSRRLRIESRACCMSGGRAMDGC